MLQRIDLAQPRRTFLQGWLTWAGEPGWGGHGRHTNPDPGSCFRPGLQSLIWDKTGFLVSKCGWRVRQCWLYASRSPIFRWKRELLHREHRANAIHRATSPHPRKIICIRWKRIADNTDVFSRQRILHRCSELPRFIGNLLKTIPRRPPTSFVQFHRARIETALGGMLWFSINPEWKSKARHPSCQRWNARNFYNLHAALIQQMVDD